jgi:hypothetical protein
VNAQYRFVMNPTGDYTVHFADPDMYAASPRDSDVHSLYLKLLPVAGYSPGHHSALIRQGIGRRGHLRARRGAYHLSNLLVTTYCCSDDEMRPCKSRAFPPKSASLISLNAGILLPMHSSSDQHFR